jgi:fructose-bisphosphate aldolase class I
VTLTCYREHGVSTKTLEATAQALVANGKGILATDETFSTIEERFKKINLESTEETRCVYREMLLTTRGLGEFVSGVILFDEMLRQATRDGTPIPKLLEDRGMIPGIKVDKGAKPLTGFDGEKVTEGLDGLRDRLSEYRELGARFVKWRAVITIANGAPSRCCIDTNANALARYAALSQEAGLVPIVEPEVLMAGDHTIAQCEEVTAVTLKTVFYELHKHRVHLEGSLLKPNMVLSGKGCTEQAEIQQVAEATVRCLRRSVPAAVPGIVFLSGGQSPQTATAHLDAINRLGHQPWELSFAYGRALQGPALEAWDGKAGNVEAAQAILYHRAKCNGAARRAEYSKQMEIQAPCAPHRSTGFG